MTPFARWFQARLQRLMEGQAEHDQRQHVNRQRIERLAADQRWDLHDHVCERCGWAVGDDLWEQHQGLCRGSRVGVLTGRMDDCPLCGTKVIDRMLALHLKEAH